MILYDTSNNNNNKPTSPSPYLVRMHLSASSTTPQQGVDSHREPGSVSSERVPGGISSRVAGDLRHPWGWLF